MRWILDKLIYALVLLICISNADALRIARPITLNHPINEEQVNEINNIFEDLFDMQTGRYELDIVTTSKTQAKNGELWLIQTGNTVRIQYRAGTHVYTLTPDGF